MFCVVVAALFVAATLQNSELLTAFGVKPNLVLMLLASLTFFIPRLFVYGSLAVLGALFIDFAPGLSQEGVAMLIVALFLYYLRARFINAGTFTAVGFAAFATVLFYLLVSPTLLYHEVGMVLAEFAYNAFWVAILFNLNYRIYEKQGGPSIR